MKDVSGVMVAAGAMAAAALVGDAPKLLSAGVSGAAATYALKNWFVKKGDADFEAVLASVEQRAIIAWETWEEASKRDPAAMESAKAAVREALSKYGPDPSAFVAEDLDPQRIVTAFMDAAAAHPQIAPPAPGAPDPAENALARRLLEEILTAAASAMVVNTEFVTRLGPALHVRAFARINEVAAEMQAAQAEMESLRADVEAFPEVVRQVVEDNQMPLAMAREIVRQFGLEKPNPTPFEIAAYLHKKAEESRASHERRGVLTSEDPQVGKLRIEALSLLEQRDIVGADAALTRAEALTPWRSYGSSGRRRI